MIMQFFVLNIFGYQLLFDDCFIFKLNSFIRKIRMKRTSRSKKKLSPATLSKNNNFSENYLRYTGSRKFMTPKKTVVFSDIKEVSGSRN